ncbi:MAG: YcxB family protein [Oscillospiraceae bacterium]|nr:YcxB family protein [Oscillospiraceae bacterium]
MQIIELNGVLMKIDYDVSVSETEVAFILFWKKYRMKSAILYSIVFAIATFLSINMMINGDMVMVGGISAGLAMGLLVNLWLKPQRIKKRLAMALETMGDEKYSAAFNNDAIEIQTITETPDIEKNESGSDNENNAEVEQGQKPDKSVYCISQEELCSKETAEMFILYINKLLFHVFPKRCMTEKDIEELRTYFKEKKI